MTFILSKLIILLLITIIVVIKCTKDIKDITSSFYFYESFDDSNKGIIVLLL